VDKIIVDIPYKNLNKRVYFWGYKPKQLLIFASIIALIFLISIFFSKGILRFIIGPLIAAPIIVIMGKVRKQNKNGVPDYASTMILYFFSPKILNDEGSVMSKLNENRLIDE